MTLLRPPSILLASVLAALVPALSAAPAAQAADIPDIRGQSYVALGDSYAGGLGLAVGDVQPAPGCFQSDQDYPHLLAERFGLVLDDRACAGATIANVATSAQTTAGGEAPVQIDALGADTALVTLSVGGNDIGLAQVVESCLAASATGPLLAGAGGATYDNCRVTYVEGTPDGEVDLLRQAIDERVGPPLAEALAEITRRAPRAAVVVVGYPALAPDAANTPVGGCFSSATPGANAYPFTDTDTAYFAEAQAYLDAVLASAAENAGAVYVSVLEGSLAHSPCAALDPYVNGITLTAGSSLVDVGLEPQSLHPTGAGVAFLTERATVGIRAAFDERRPGPDPASAPAPAGSSADGSGVPARRLAETGTAPVVPAVALATLMLVSGSVVMLRRRRAG